MILIQRLAGPDLHFGQLTPQGGIAGETGGKQDRKRNWYSFPRADITKNHKVGSLKNRNFLSHSSGG